MTEPKIVILGGYGALGRLIAEQLAQSGAQVIGAGRKAVKGQRLLPLSSSTSIPAMPECECEIRSFFASLHEGIVAARAFSVFSQAFSL